MAKQAKDIIEETGVNVTEAAETEEIENKKDIELPDETIEKLIKNEYQMNSVGTDEVEIPVVEPKTSTETEEIENKKDDEIKEVEYNDVDYQSRGFASLEDAIDFMETPYFKGLGEADKNEYKNWLIK